MTSVREEPPAKTVGLNNRKYLGAKYRLLDFIASAILARAGKSDRYGSDPSRPGGKPGMIGTFIDGFAGTGVVGHHFRRHAERIVSNDLLLSNFIINKAFLCSTRRNVSLEKINRLLGKLNRSAGREGYAYRHYGGTYFTPQNAALIDAIRERIESFFLSGECGEQEKYVLLTSLLLAVDKVANTVGQYDAFLKHLARAPRQRARRHLIDSNVHKRIRLLPPSLDLEGPNQERNRVYREDLNALILEISGDVLYLDPPYNSRQFIDCYHVLENIARWDKPALYGKTRKFRREQLKSRYSRKGECVSAFRELIARARVKHIFLSYNNEGLIPDAEIGAILGSRGKVECLEQDYGVFGNGAGVSQRRRVTERLFHCRVDNC